MERKKRIGGIKHTKSYSRQEANKQTDGQTLLVAKEHFLVVGQVLRSDYNIPVESQGQ